jgi:hypothetical protein
MNDKQAQFLPFHAINQFMLDEFRLEIIREVLNRSADLSASRKGALGAQIRRHVNLPGFRNSANAPAPLKLKGSITAFERSPEFAAHVLQAWSELRAELRQQVYEMLVAREWKLLPAEVDRTKLPGFLTEWPEEETYEMLNQAFSEANPDSAAGENDVRLMVVWLAGRLPYSVTESGEAEE